MENRIKLFLNLMSSLRKCSDQVADVYHSINGSSADMEEAKGYTEVQELISEVIAKVGILLGESVSEQIIYEN